MIRILLFVCSYVVYIKTYIDFIALAIYYCIRLSMYFLSLYVFMMRFVIVLLNEYE